MNQIRRMAGFIWMALGPVAIWWLVKTAAAEIAKKPQVDTKVQWTVFILVFLPIVLGVFLFGYYAIKGEYDSKS